MSDISIPGLSSNSKYNTTKIIEDLVEAEKIPMKRMEKEVETFEKERSIWQGLNRQTSALQRVAKKLYSFENPFNEKMVTSSEESVLTATAEREADFSDYTLEVKQVARADKFLSNPLSSDTKVPAGKYTFKIGEESLTLKYRGGKLSDFVKKINRKDDSLLKMTLIKNSPESRVLVVESQVPGRSNPLIFEDDAVQWALDMGLMRKMKGEQRDISFSTENIKKAENIDFGDSEILLRMNGKFTLDIDPAYSVSSGTILEMKVKTIDLDENYYRDRALPEPPVPPVPDGSFQDIRIFSEKSILDLPKDTITEPPVFKEDDRFLYAVGDGNRMPLTPLQDNQEFQSVEISLAGRMENLEQLVFVNNNSYKNIVITDIRISEPNPRGDYEPLNPVSSAQNAVIKYEGIVIERESNSIDDLIPGVILDLKKASEEPVDLTIEPDSEVVKDALIEFTYNYNKTLTQILILTSDDSAVVDEIEYFTDEERKDAMDNLGRFRGDLTLMQLKSKMQMILSESYETNLGDEMALLAQIGISTNETGSNGGSVDYTKLRGYLEIDEEKLTQVISRDVESLKELFGSDSNGDYIIDTGAAKKLDEYLTPYTRTGGILTLRVDRLQGDIDDKKEDIEDYKEHLVDYEQELRIKYGQMEGMLNQLEHNSQSLDAFNNNNK